MTAISRIFLASTALIAASACASSGTSGGTPGPVLTPGGGVSPQRNLILTDISYGHPSNGDGVDQTFDLAVGTMVLDKDPNTGGLVLNEYTRSNFTDANTMTYDHDANTFTFDISQGSTSFQETFGLMMLTNPVDLGYQYNDMAIIISAFPERFGLDPADYLGQPWAVDNYLFGLVDSGDDNDAAIFASLELQVEYIVGSDWFTYSSNGRTYNQLKLSNAAVDTNYTSLGIWYDEDNVRDTFGVAVFGERTPAFDIPTTGTASYEATIAGQLLLENTAHFMTGGITFDFNFVSQTLAFFIDADLAESGIDGSAVYLDYDTFTGNGTIEGTFFSGNFVSDSDSNILGTLEGNFFGADADEVAGTLEFSSTNILGLGGFIGANPEATSQN